MAFSIRFYCVLIFWFAPIANAAQSPIPVFTAVVEAKMFADEIEALGTLKANENVELTSTVTDLVTKINFEDGMRVKQGDILVEMDASEEFALKAEEQSRLEEAKRQVDRLKPLIAREATSRLSFDEAQLEIRTTQARLKALDSRIAQRRITAPFNGVVGLRNISVGSLIQPGTLITTIDNDSVMKLDFSVPEVFLTALSRGVTIESRTKAYPNEVFKGTIASVDSRIDSISRAITVRALLTNESYKLKPGLLMRVKIQKNPRQALIIPEESIVIKGNQKSVFVIQEDDATTTVSKISIKTGARRKGEIEVLEGLSEGDRIVTHGTLRLRNGSAVQVTGIESSKQSIGELLQKQSSIKE